MMPDDGLAGGATTEPAIDGRDRRLAAIPVCQRVPISAGVAQPYGRHKLVFYELDAAVMRGDEVGPLHGIPIAIKDLTPTRGKRTTMGSRTHEHWVPDRSAVIVDRLLGAGAILIGKTTTPEFAYASFTQSPLWGITRNPWDTQRTPGGSSGG
ncbi:MAG: amidase, partial [Akkermansiaceae bacterium]|nr:amidase [Akkermansiaceae bacterium]